MDPNVYEKLGAFFLGRQQPEPPGGETSSPEEVPFLYDSKDLTTHAMCVGMTGSGKTGLCVTLLEEAAIDGIPALVIDPKGDLGNLLLTFPNLAPEDFRPWIDEDEARRKGVDADTFAAQQAALWKKGLASWGQDGERIARLRAAAEISIYTPGSHAGLPISIRSFAAPKAAIRDDADALREHTSAVVTSLLALLGIDADPIQSREHILLSNIFDQAFRQGRDLDLASLIREIQEPPMTRVGVMPLDTFYPQKDRFALAMALNNLLASPGFEAWMRGEPLEVDRLLYSDTGKPRIAIFSLAHLSDAKRMFFLTLLLSQTLAWMRSQPGTSSLRAILYMDEVFGYLPPVAEPPSKRPLLTLLKQARAYGLGLVLATQNPADLDYKALSNIGTWFLGRLQTERDKERVLDGMIGTAQPEGLSRRDLAHTLSGLGKRVFLLHNVHEQAPVVFHVRWAMSYLRGPLTREQIKTLMAPRRKAAGKAQQAGVSATPSQAPTRPSAATPAAQRPILPPELAERFLPLAGAPGPEVVYRPGLLGTARVLLVDTRKGLREEQHVVLYAELDEATSDLDWYQARELDLDPARLESAPASNAASFLPLPQFAGDAKRYRRFEKDLAEALYRSRRAPVLKSPSTGLCSKPGENERSFRIRLADAIRTERDDAIEKLRKRYKTRLRSAEERVRKAEQRVQKEALQAKDQKWQAAVSVGSTLLGALFGRRRSFTTAGRSLGRTLREGQDVKRAQEDVEAKKALFEELEAELRTEIESIGERLDAQNEALETCQLKPRRGDIDIQLIALTWEPHRRRRDNSLEASWG